VAVYDTLHELVLTGSLEPNIRLSESSLADRLGVSRTPVREALQRLEANELVFAQGRGVRVRVLDDVELQQVYEARAALDAFVAGKLAVLNGAGELAPARLGKLSALAAETDALTRDGRLVEATQRNREFHQSIARLAGNAAMVATLDGYWDRIIVSTRQHLDRSDRAVHVHAEHQQILSAITAGDWRAAYSAAETHALNTSSTLTK
jgi:DNA-binding GntR family transcriptional regulator